VFNLVAMAGYVIVILVPTWQAVILGAILFISWTALSLPATMSMVSSVLPKNKRTMGVSLHSLVRRIPMALSPGVGGLLIASLGERDGVRAAFVLGLVALVMQQLLIDNAPGDDRAAERNPLAVLRFMSPDLRNLLVSDILVRYCSC